MHYADRKIPECAEDLAGQIAAKWTHLTDDEWFICWAGCMLVRLAEMIVLEQRVDIVRDPADFPDLFQWWNHVVRSARCAKKGKEGGA